MNINKDNHFSKQYDILFGKRYYTYIIINNNVPVTLINNKEFVFWDDFCSKYPDWVGPNTVANYLGETTDHAHSIHAVHFR